LAVTAVFAVSFVIVLEIHGTTSCEASSASPLSLSIREFPARYTAMTVFVRILRNA
jgi:hypothetical protein